ncbi:hypothetical protein FOZ60_006461 [Perkinsus olseni]|uniref:Arf-GAP domain-containing protein n=1 Tax=Perkinsus olseni TaxID=32597 RepID=A0A7J6PFG0_PEROL|nr:hypothetical protein FOZ60_006461 [Perkinsus olseni]
MCAVYASPSSSFSSSSGPIVVRPITDITQGPVAAAASSAAFSPACDVGRSISDHTPAAVAQLPGAASVENIPSNADGGVAVTVDDDEPEVPPDEEAFPVLPYQKASFLRKNWMRFPPLLITLLLELIPSLLYTEGSGALTNLIGEDRADLFMGLRAVVTAVAGNFSLQNSSNMSRWLAMGIVTRGTWRREIWGEIKANLLTSLVLSLVMMLTTGLGLCPWKLHDHISGENMWFGFVISLVLFLTANIGGLVGMLSPLLLQFVLKLDPAACAGPGETCFQDILDSILSRPENSVCADCNAPNPRWASVNLGVFICTNCAGIHRGIGTHITFVQSATIDQWKPEWVALADAVGNKVANEYYEYNVPPHIHKPDGSSFPNGGGGGDRLDPDTSRHLERWIRNKYELKLFANYSAKEPCVAFADGELVGPLGLGGPNQISPTATPVGAGVMPNGYINTPKKSLKKKKRSSKHQWSETTSEGASHFSLREQAYVDVSHLDPQYLRLAPSQQGWQNNFFISSWISDVSQGHDQSRATI